MRREPVQIGERFGRLEVLRVYSPRRRDQFRVLCLCDCLEVLSTTSTHLRAGKLKSCGCFRRDRAGQLYRKHGKSKTVQYCMFYDARKRAIERGLPFRISPEDIRIPDVCPVLGVPLVLVGPRDNRPSLDRIVPEKGYTLDNIRVISFRANRIKSDASLSELKAVMRYVEEGST